MSDIKKGLFSTRITVRENTRALVLKDGKFDRILKPGRHTLPSWRIRLEVNDYDLNQGVFLSDFAKTIFKDAPELAAAHLMEVRTAPEEFAMLLRDGKLFGFQKPDSRSVVWKDAGPWEVERFDASADLRVPSAVMRRIGAAGVAEIRKYLVENGQVGLLYIDNELVETLEPGVYGFWNAAQSVNVRQIDLREQSLDVNGQEVLTRDKVTIRINVSAKYRVVDPVKAVGEVKDFLDALYRAMQFAFRKMLATKTLDEILGNKALVDAEAEKTVKAEMESIGLAVSEIAIKDVILPGEMRDLLNMVVMAEKEAQANIIRRREETAATRALLNTARVMDENPTMLRLKELDALETIAASVDTLTIHNGTQGLLEGLVDLGSKTKPKSSPKSRSKAGRGTKAK